MQEASLTAAQMHLGFCIAMKLIDGEVFVDHMVEENIARPDLLAFGKKAQACGVMAGPRLASNDALRKHAKASGSKPARSWCASGRDVSNA